MIADPSQAFGFYAFFIALLFIAGAYCLLVTRNLIRLLIGLEILVKAVTLLMVLVGSLTGREALAQTMVITLIVVEVVIMVVAGGVTLCVFRNQQDISTDNLRNLKG